MLDPGILSMWMLIEVNQPPKHPCRSGVPSMAPAHPMTLVPQKDNVCCHVTQEQPEELPQIWICLSNMGYARKIKIHRALLAWRGGGGGVALSGKLFGWVLRVNQQPHHYLDLRFSHICSPGEKTARFKKLGTLRKENWLFVCSGHFVG